MNKIELIKKLREVTGLGLNECKKALESTNWDYDSAFAFAKENIRPSTKPTGAGAVFSYIHHNQLIGVLLELHCATDFVAKSEEFSNLGNALAMHIAGMEPWDIDELLSQNSLKNSSITIETMLNEASARFNEPIRVKRFQRYALGV